MMVTILGAKGFVGSALTRRLQKNGQRVVLLDLPEFDLTRPQTFGLIPSDTDILVHAAGHVGTAPDDQIIWKVNVESTYYLIQYLNTSCRPRLVVYLSSGGVYGMQSEPVTVRARSIRIIYMLFRSFYPSACWKRWLVGPLSFYAFFFPSGLAKRYLDFFRA